MNYIAKQDGFIGGFRRKKGEVFAHEGKPGTWMELVKDHTKDKTPVKEVDKAGKSKHKDTEPQTFSEMAHRDGAELGPKGK
jgi:hypothetical protein